MPFIIYGVAFLILPAVIIYLADTKREGRSPGPGCTSKIPWLAVTALYLAAAFNSVIFYLIPTQLPFYLYSLGVNAPLLIGVTIGMFTLSIATGSLGYGKVRQHIPLMGMFAIGFSLMAAGYYVMASAASHILVLAGLVIAGVGMSGIMPSLMAGAMSIAPPSSRGRIAGGLTASIFLGQFVSPLVSQFWIQWLGYQATFRDMGTALIAAALIALAVTMLNKREPAEEHLD
jgi:MFS family permease